MTVIFWQISSSTPENINLQGGEFAKAGEHKAHTEGYSSLAMCSSPEPISFQIIWESQRTPRGLLCAMEKATYNNTSSIATIHNDSTTIMYSYIKKCTSITYIILIYISIYINISII